MELLPQNKEPLLLKEKTISINSVDDAISHGILYASEDRRKFGLVMPMSLIHNTTLATMKEHLNAFGLLDDQKEEQTTQKFKEQLNIRAQDLRAQVATLSGGNQQKVMLAKWLTAKPKVLIVDEPTRGIDVGSKAEIHRMLRKLANDNIAIVVISSDMPEVLALGDTIVVMREGKQTAIIKRKEASQEKIMTYAAS